MMMLGQCQASASRIALRVCAWSAPLDNLSDIHIIVSRGNHAEVFLTDALVLSGKLSDSTERSSLSGQAASARVNLSVEHEDDIFARSEQLLFR